MGVLSLQRGIFDSKNEFGNQSFGVLSQQLIIRENKQTSDHFLFLFACFAATTMFSLVAVIADVVFCQHINT